MTTRRKTSSRFRGAGKIVTVYGEEPAARAVVDPGGPAPEVIMERNHQRRVDLDAIEIKSPCSLPWDAMPGDDRTRFCGQCGQHVYNIAGLTRREAQRLIANRTGRLCGRVLRRPDGTVVTADCWARLRAARRKGLLQAVAVLVLVVVPELIAMRFGIGNLLRLTALPPLERGAPAIDMPPPPVDQVVPGPRWEVTEGLGGI